MLAARGLGLPNSVSREACPERVRTRFGTRCLSRRNSLQDKAGTRLRTRCVSRKAGTYSDVPGLHLGTRCLWRASLPPTRSVFQGHRSRNRGRCVPPSVRFVRCICPAFFCAPRLGSRSTPQPPRQSRAIQPWTAGESFFYVSKIESRKRVLFVELERPKFAVIACNESRRARMAHSAPGTSANGRRWPRMKNRPWRS